MSVSGRYVIFEEIAAGGMARVHLARLRGPAGFGKTVAVKRLPAEVSHDAGRVEALIAEARHVSRIRHPNVVSVIDVIDDERGVGIVMELVHGVALATLMSEARLKGERIAPAVAVAIVAGVLRGLSAAHQARDESGEPMGLVHRDVSPQNVLVGADGVARVVDFGIAKAVHLADATRGAELKGKPAYMAPEQLRGEAVDARTDVYAASVIAWELVTGQRLFSADSDYAAAQKVLHRAVDAPTRILPEVPDALSEVILRGLARDPEERFASALDAAEALERAVPSASPSDVAKVVTSLCQPGLDELEELVRRAEARDAEPMPTHRRSGPRSAWAAAAVGIAVLAGWGVSARSGPTSRLASFPPIPRIPIAAPAASPTPKPRAAPAPSSAPPAAIPAPRPAPKAMPPASASATAPPPAPDCEPPYVVDENGFHHMKPECLGR